jgi:serine protease Do
VIVRYDGRPVEGPRVLSGLVAATEVGRLVEVGIARDGRPETLRVTIGSRPEARVAVLEPPSVKRLGVQLQTLTPDLARQLGAGDPRGVVVTDVRPDSPAARAGLFEGDLIREVNRTPVADVEQVAKALETSQRNQILLRVERQGAARYIVMDLG